MDAWTLVITGCGTSHGSPPWGWPEQWSTDPRDHRRRSGAVLLGPRGEAVLIDAGPDLMHQLRDPFNDWDGLSYPARCITRCDGVLITHDHADHTHGLNELRHLNRLMGGGTIRICGHATHLAMVRRMFPYCFEDGHDEAYALAKPRLELHQLTDHLPAHLAGLTVTPFPVGHGSAGRTTAYRIGGLAYCTDVKTVPADALAHLRDAEVLVLGMLREDEHETHMNWAEARALIRAVAPRRTILVHMGPEVRYAEWQARLPPGVELAVDGTCATFSAGTP